MAEDADDQWLYGEVLDSEKQEEEGKENEQTVPKELLQEEDKERDEQGGDDTVVPGEEIEAEPPENEPTTEANESKDSGTAGDEDDDESDDDDDIQVTIGEFKTGPEAISYDMGNTVPLKRIYQPPKPDKPQHNVVGGLSMVDIESFNLINGEPSHEFNLDALEDKPWRKPGADITDYFNYGFTEETWKGYCEKQKNMRSEAGAAPILASGKILGDNLSRLNARAGPPPGRRLTGSIDVIGGSISSRRFNDPLPATNSENAIQVMTADKREYSRKNLIPDLSQPPPVGVPPPTFNVPPPSVPQTFNGNSQFPATDNFFPPVTDQYFNSYEPTQDSQWNASQNWGSDQAPPPTFITPITTEDTDTNKSKSSDKRSGTHSKRGRSDSRSPERHRSPSRQKSPSRHRSPSRRRSESRHRDRHRERDRNRSRSRSRSRHHSSRPHKRSKRD